MMHASIHPSIHTYKHITTSDTHQRRVLKPLFFRQGDMAPAAIVMSFGSGHIAAQIASDEASETMMVENGHV